MRRKRNLGPIFPDEVNKVTGKIGHFTKKRETDWVDLLLPNFDTSFGNRFTKSPWRIAAFQVICIILFFILFLRIFHLQITEGKTNRELADGNRIQVKVIHAPRGVIFDRNGKILAANSPAFRLLDPQINRIRLISREDALEMEVKNDPKVSSLEVDNVRSYPMSEKLAHVVGYIGEISDSQLQSKEFKNYRLGDRIGQSGIEATYEKMLRGVDGGEIIEVDSSGKKLRTLRQVAPIPGQNITLTIDIDLQSKIYEQLFEATSKVRSCCAAAVAMDPNNGQVLALVSLPAYDPNIITQNIDDRAIADIFSQPASPLLNRVIAGTYPPGSTFKIISSLAGLVSGKIKPNTAFEDKGITYLGSYTFTNWYFTQYGKTDGLVNLSKALQRSNDTYYYLVGRLIGENVLEEWARKLKLGEKLGLDLPGEEKGLIPNDEWKRKVFKQGWYPGDTLHMAIGQGFVLTTPLQILGVTSFIASNGVLYQPQLILEVNKADKITYDFKPKILVSKIVSEDIIESVAEGLKLVPKSGGTAWPFFTFPISTAGKTGTAEFGDSKNRTHAWYTSYAPADDPKIAMTVLVEAGGEGSSIAAPIAKEIYRWYLSPDKNKLIEDVYSVNIDSAKTPGE